MTTAMQRHDWDADIARRTQTLGGGEITAILALAGATDVITFSGGFPAPETFATGVLAEIAQRLISSDPAVSLQYSATEGIASVRDYVAGRLTTAQGRTPGDGELMITSGGIDCMELVAKTYLDPGDLVIVEAPTYLGAIMAFRGYEADVQGVPIDADGLRVDVLASRLAGGKRPKILYTIPDFQNPSGLSMSLERRQALVALARQYGFMILEDVAYRDLSFDHVPRQRCGRWPLTWCVQAGTFSKIFCPGFRLGWAAGPADIVARLVVAKQNSDQCFGSARPADARGVWPRRAHGAADRRVSRAVSAAGDPDRRGPRQAYARGHHVDDAAPAASTTGSRHLTAWTPWRCRRPLVRGKSRTCPDGRSILATGARADQALLQPGRRRAH